MPEIATSLAGTPLVFAADDARLLDALGATITPLRVDAVAADAFRCTIANGGPPDPPPDAVIHFDGVAPFTDSRSIFAEHRAERSITFPGRFSLVCAPQARRATIVVKPGEEALIGSIALMHLLGWVLGADDKTLLHGAALADPDDAAGILVFAPSGAGKTTLALALMKAGFRLYSDDLAVLSRRDARPWIGGLARPLKVHHKTAAMMPWLNAYFGPDWDEYGEQPLTLQAAAGFAQLTTEPRPLRAIVRLAGRSADGHVLRPIPGHEALIWLCEDNLRAGRHGTPDFERNAFRRLGAIVTDVPAYDLLVGPDPAGAPAVLAKILTG